MWKSNFLRKQKKNSYFFIVPQLLDIKFYNKINHSRKFYEMIEDVLEKNTKAKKKKASKIEDKIESFFGQSVFNKGSARHYKIALANKEYDLYLHKDHAGTQGWQTSANYALIYFLDALKSDFEKSLD